MAKTSIDGRVVAVTGGARGIGFAIAALLNRHGARVAIGDVDANAVADAGGRLGLEVAAELDVTDPGSFAHFLDTVEERLGPIDVLVNNAGIIAVGPAVDESDDVTRRVLAVNAYGVMLGTKLAIARMRPRRRGHVVNIASLGALLPVPGIATYTATKHAVLGYTDAVRLENRRSGIRFSVVMPALTNTEMVTGIGHARGIENIEPDDVAKAVLGLIGKPRTRVIVPRSFGLIATTSRKVMPQWMYEAVERAIGTERAFQDDVDDTLRLSYKQRADTL